MNYQVGDVVLIAAEHGIYSHPVTGLWHIREMDHFTGELAVVIDVDSNDETYELAANGEDTMYFWHKDWLTYPSPSCCEEDNDLDLGDLL